MVGSKNVGLERFLGPTRSQNGVGCVRIRPCLAGEFVVVGEVLRHDTTATYWEELEVPQADSKAALTLCILR